MEHHVVPSIQTQNTNTEQLFSDTLRRQFP